LIWSCFDGRPVAAAGGVVGKVLVPGMGLPVIRARSGCPPPVPAAPVAPA